MRKIASIVIIFILFSTFIIPIQEQANSQIILKNEKLNRFLSIQKARLLKKINANDFVFNPEDIELKDDAFHGSDSLNFAEWWYFDALFDNNFSVQITIYVFGVLTQKVVICGVNIYCNGDNVLSREDYYIFNELGISKETPFIEIDGKQFMRGYIDEETGRWIYDLTIDVTDASINLQFIGKVKGWKGDLSIGGWASILPKAEVSGKINLYDYEYDVKGIGYHDHNWDMNLFDLLHFGWYWGRIHSDNVTIVWFVIFNTRFDSENLCIISKEEQGYININPKDIVFITENYNLDLIWLVPKSFTLNIDSEDIYLSMDMNAESIDSDFKINGHYWRYHINCQGNIIIDENMKDISGTHIAEFMRLR